MDSKRGSKLVEGLERLVRRKKTLRAAGGVVRAVTTLLAGGLCAVVIDAAYPAGPTVRVGLGVGVIVAALGVWWMRWRRSSGAKAQLLGAAQMVERQLGITDDAVVNAASLLLDTPGGRSALTEKLVDRCVERAGKTVDRIDPATVVSAAGLMRQLGYLAAVLGVIGAVSVVRPGLVGNGGARFLWPWADYPPYGATRIELTHEPKRVLIGDTVTVTARLSGRQSERAELVALDLDTGERLAGWGMDLAGPGLFTFAYPDLRGPIWVRVETEFGRSRPYLVEVSGGDLGSNEKSRVAAADVEGAVNEAVAVERLVGLSEQLKEQAERALVDQDRSVAAGGDRTGVEAVAEQINGLLDRFDELVQGLRNPRPRQGEDAVARGLSRTEAASGVELSSAIRTAIAETAGRLRLANHPRYSSSVANRGSEGEMDGGSSSLRGWLAEVGLAAGHDREMLRGWLMGLISGEQGGQADGSVMRGSGWGERSTLEFAQTEGQASGIYREKRGRSTTMSSAEIQAYSEEAPVMYREAVAHYFERIIRDQALESKAVGTEPQDSPR